MTYNTRPIDDDVAHLDGGLFSKTPYRVIPLDNFRLEDRQPQALESQEASVTDDDLEVISERPLAAPVETAETVPTPMRVVKPTPAAEPATAPVAKPAAVVTPIVAALEPDPTPKATVYPTLSASARRRRPAPRRRFSKTGFVAGAAAMSMSGLALAAMLVKSDAPPPAGAQPLVPVVTAVAATPPAATAATAEETAMDDEEEALAEAPVPVVTATPLPPSPPILAPKTNGGTMPAIAFRLPEVPAPEPTVDRDISRSAAAVAIAAAGRRASYCTSPDAPVSVPVAITFAPSGNVTRAIVSGGPFAGTSEGSCIASSLRTASVPAFDGEPVTVNTTVVMR